MSRLAFWTQRSARERTVITILGGIVAAVLLVAFAWLPLERARARLTAELPALRASVAQKRLAVSSARSATSSP